MRVYIIGAGPGDPGLITLRGAELIASCPIVLYTGSLVPRELTERARADARVLDSSGMTLPEITELLRDALRDNQDVARVHTGDPLIFGSTAEQMRAMRELGIEYEIVPGVSSFTAAAAVLGCELTLPEVSQAVILARAEGRTRVPAGQQLAELAGHRATLALFLSVALIRRVVADLSPIYGEDTPVAVVYKASCPDQIVVTGTLATIVELVQRARITNHAMIIVGDVLTCESYPNSRLYDPSFSHGYRRGTKKPRSPMVS